MDSLRATELNEPPRRRDDGAVLVMALVFVLLCSLVVTPMLRYAWGVTRNSRVQAVKSARAEAVKGALRVALSDGSKLYDACSNSGLHTEVTLANPGLTTPVTTVCTTVKNATELSAADLRTAMTVIQAGAAAPAGTVGAAYAGNGSATINAWLADTTATSTAAKILFPNLADHGLTHPSSTGYDMPAWAGACKVFFPGTYNNPVVISSSTPTYFASGIYYFESSVTFTGNANVVVGGGAHEGCTNDQDAAYNAINAPLNHNITDFGATFVFGAAGRLIVDDTTVAGTGPQVYFNTRLVADTDVGSIPSRGVSIISVNGVQTGPTSSGDLNLPGQLFVPHSLTGAAPASDAAAYSYVPSTLVPTVAPNPQTAAIIDVHFTTTHPGVLFVPGYVSVPQGRISINVDPGMGAGKDVELVGGVLAALFTQSVAVPANNQLGIVNRIVQKTFKIVSSTTSGVPTIVSTALVEVNDFGVYVVNSWEITVAAS